MNEHDRPKKQFDEIETREKKSALDELLCWVAILKETPTQEGLYIVRWPNGRIEEAPIEDIQSWGKHKLHLKWLGPLPWPPTT